MNGFVHSKWSLISYRKYVALGVESTHHSLHTWQIAPRATKVGAFCPKLLYGEHNQKTRTVRILMSDMTAGFARQPAALDLKHVTSYLRPHQ